MVLALAQVLRGAKRRNPWGIASTIRQISGGAFAWLAPGLAFASKPDDSYGNATGEAKFLCQNPVFVSCYN
jgi:hypothetical protein